MAIGKALGAFGLTESGGGTVAGATKTTAKLDDGAIRDHGSKQFITNSGTDVTKLVTVTVTAVTGEAAGKKQISSILVPVPTKGFTAEPAYDEVGWNASDTHALSSHDVRVPRENPLGQQGRGYANFVRILDGGRVAIAALSVGVAHGYVDDGVTYAKQREASARRSAPPRRSRSRSPGWRPTPTPYTTPTTTPPHSCRRNAAQEGRAIAKLVASEAAMDNALMRPKSSAGTGS